MSLAPTIVIRLVDPGAVTKLTAPVPFALVVTV